MRVKVSFGPRTQIGFVVGLLEESAIVRLKPILSLCDDAPVFNSLDLVFCQGFLRVLRLQLRGSPWHDPEE